MRWTSANFQNHNFCVYAEQHYNDDPESGIYLIYSQRFSRFVQACLWLWFVFDSMADFRNNRNGRVRDNYIRICNVHRWIPSVIFVYMDIYVLILSLVFNESGVTPTSAWIYDKIMQELSLYLNLNRSSTIPRYTDIALFTYLKKVYLATFMQFLHFM